MNTTWPGSLILLVLLIAALPAGAEPPGAPVTERVFWERAPLRVTLKVGAERTVTFPGPVRVGMPPERLASLRTQSVDGTVYWLAKEPFEVTRVPVQQLDTGQTFLLDVQAVTDHPTPPPLQVLLRQLDPEDGVATRPGTSRGRLDCVALTRYAAQQLYAPRRLLRELPGIAQVPLGAQSTVPLVRGGQIEAIPLVSWQRGDLYVTAVKLRNLGTRGVTLDPRDLRGHWVARTFQHARLLPAGDEADTSTVYLVSTRPFEESL